MRLVATLLVRDEIDLVAATVEHLLDQGVAHVVATDNGSVDGTREVLAQYAATGRVSVIDEPDHTFRQSQWVTRMARQAATEHGADWVLNADADEFWVPKDRRLTLAASLAEVGPEHALISARRTDLLGVRGARGHWSRRLVWRDLLTLSPRGTPRLPKVAHRADPGVVVAQGNHEVTPTGTALPTEPWDLYHVPLRSWPQFERVIVNGGSALAANRELEARFGWHWRADYERHLAGTLRAEYDSRLPTRRDLLRRVRAGEVRRDTFLRDHLRGLQTRAVHPELLAAALGRRVGARGRPAGT